MRLEGIAVRLRGEFILRRFSAVSSDGDAVGWRFKVGRRALALCGPRTDAKTYHSRTSCRSHPILA